MLDSRLTYKVTCTMLRLMKAVILRHDKFESLNVIYQRVFQIWRGDPCVACAWVLLTLNLDKVANHQVTKVVCLGCILIKINAI